MRRFAAGTFLASIALVSAGMAIPSSAAATDQSDRMSTRIVGGETADRSTTGWFLQFLPDFGGAIGLCGATAIASDWAVTAAHCVVSDVGEYIRLGTDRSSVIINPGSTRTGTRHWIDRVVVHPGYRPGASTHRNDIALLHTSSVVGTTTLPLNSDPSTPATGTTEYVYGFGSVGSGRHLSSTLLRGTVTDLAGPSSAVCGSYGSIYDPTVQLCAGLPGGGVDACQGDSGGPLTAVVGGTTRLVGIVSEGIGCAEAAFPGLYTRVSSFASWATNTIAPRARWKLTPNPRKRLVANRGRKLEIVLKNRGTIRGSWRAVAGSGLGPTVSRGSVRPKKQRVVKLNVKTSACLVTYLDLELADASTVRYRVKLNPRRCGK